VNFIFGSHIMKYGTPLRWESIQAHVNQKASLRDVRQLQSQVSQKRPVAESPWSQL
jgi:hypothetical protein